MTKEEQTYVLKPEDLVTPDCDDCELPVDICACDDDYTADEKGDDREDEE